MNAVGIDVSKGKSKIAIIRQFGEVIAKPFDIEHFPDQLAELYEYIHSLDGESRVVIEHTGKYSDPIANFLCKVGIFVCMVNAKLIHDYGGDTIRRVKTDKVDALKIAGYCLDKWAKLTRYEPIPDNRKMLKTYNRQLSEYNKIKSMLKNDLISLLGQTFPGINDLFTSSTREKDDHEKWIDFALKFPHCNTVSTLSRQAFATKYEKWYRKSGYYFALIKLNKFMGFLLNVCQLCRTMTFPKHSLSKPSSNSMQVECQQHRRAFSAYSIVFHAQARTLRGETGNQQIPQR